MVLRLEEEHDSTQSGSSHDVIGEATTGETAQIGFFITTSRNIDAEMGGTKTAGLIFLEEVGRLLSHRHHALCVEHQSHR